MAIAREYIPIPNPPAIRKCGECKITLLPANHGYMCDACQALSDAVLTPYFVALHQQWVRDIHNPDYHRTFFTDRGDDDDLNPKG